MPKGMKKPIKRKGAVPMVGTKKQKKPKAIAAPKVKKIKKPKLDAMPIDQFMNTRNGEIGAF